MEDFIQLCITCLLQICVFAVLHVSFVLMVMYRAADKYLARPTSRCILLDGENISFAASLVIYK